MTQLNASSKTYQKKKEKLVQSWMQHKEIPTSLQKSTSNLFRDKEKTTAHRLDVRSFNRVLSIDRELGLVETEAMITYEDLINETLKFSLLPAVVPELKSITIGGAFAGVGIEAASYRYGFVHETVTEIEVLTAEGQILICTPTNEHQDLFYGFANSYGTLGYILRLKAKLIPAKPYVQLSHIHFSDQTLFFNHLRDCCDLQRPYAFVEGVIFSPKEMHITIGEFVAQAPFVSDYTYMQPYFRSIRNKETDYLSTHDFIWRWDADWFWCSKHFGMQQRFLRFCLGKFLLKSTVYWKIMRLVNSRPWMQKMVTFFTKRTESIIQDIVIPIDKAPEFLNFLSASIGITPIWTCPYRAYEGKNPFSFVPTDPSTLYVDFGFWDKIPSDKPSGYYNRLIEQKTAELKGFKSLYSDSFYTEEEFWNLFSKPLFLQLKSKYDPKKTLKTLFEKCVKCNRGLK